PAILTRTPYVTHVNGTLFWFPPNMDVNKYALLYRRALRRVLAVSPGHAEFIPLLPPPMTLRRRVRIEATALLHWLAVRTARQRISLSRRMAWEVETLYGKPTR